MMMVADSSNRIGKIMLEKWKQEPDHFDYEHENYHLVVLRGPFGSLNGYVGVKEGHPAFGAGYMDDVVDHIQVHGGLTYSGSKLEHFKPDMWYFGFDTAHYGDYSPGLKRPKMPPLPDGMTLADLPAELREIYELDSMLEEVNELTSKMGGGFDKINNPENYKDIEYVISEVKDLYQQLYDMELDAQVSESLPVTNRVKEVINDVGDSEAKEGIPADDPAVRAELQSQSGLQPGKPNETGDDTGSDVPEGDNG